jgi:predicted adenine nucleotide alpha hydrolase (AANH) superfamily ATPase
MKVVLHICCGICAAGVVEKLAAEGHQILGFFCNPNLYPEQEFDRRREVAEKVAREFKFHLETVPYLPEEWSKETSCLADEPEDGRRCEVCFRLRLQKTCLYMMDCGGDAFTTTLTIGRRKSADIINRIGREVGGDRFLARDFKKKGGFKRAMELAKRWELYRQHYCGCMYSFRENDELLPDERLSDRMKNKSDEIKWPEGG